MVKKYIILSIYCFLNTIVSSFAQPGSLDSTFGIGGKVLTNFGVKTQDKIRSVVIQNDGKIVAVGWSKSDFAAVRYNVDGSLDNSFGLGGKVTTSVGSSSDEANSVVIQGDGKIVLAGITISGYDNDDIALVRYNADGTLDSTFDFDGKVVTSFGSNNERAHSIIIQTDGKLLVAGSIENGASRNEIILLRYTIDGILDTSFNHVGFINTGFPFSDASASSIVLQENGQIILGGVKSVNFANQSDVVLLRYNINGTIDTTFGEKGIVINDFGSTEDGVTEIALQSDEKIIVSGWTGVGANTSDFAVTRYANNGTLDSAFGINGHNTFNFQRIDYSLSMAIQGDDKILMAGWTLADVGYPTFALIRCTASGFLDSSFGSAGVVTTDFGNQADGANTIVIQTDGKIIVGGTSNYESTPGVYESDFVVARYINDLQTGIDVKSIKTPEVNIFPSPSSGIITVDTQNGQDMKMGVYDLLGNCLWYRNCRNEVSWKIDLSSQPKGVYFIEIVSEYGRTANKIVLQ